jgi:hypothetical protein
MQQVVAVGGVVMDGQGQARLRARMIRETQAFLDARLCGQDDGGPQQVSRRPPPRSLWRLWYTRREDGGSRPAEGTDPRDEAPGRN